jgi:hypothetical protein
MQQVSVEPLPVGWRVTSSKGLHDQFFLSGKAAEAAGKTLALKLAEAGDYVELKLRLRDGRIGAKRLSLPPVRPGDVPLLIEAPPVLREAGVSRETSAALIEPAR